MNFAKFSFMLTFLFSAFLPRLHASDLTGDKVLEALRERDNILYSGFSASLAGICNLNTANPKAWDASIQIAGQKNKMVSVFTKVLTSKALPEYTEGNGERYKLVDTHQVFLLDEDGSSARFIGHTSELVSLRPDGNSDIRSLAADVWKYATQEAFVVLSIYRPLLIFGRGYSKWIDSLDLVSLDFISGVAHLRGSGRMFVGESEKTEANAVGTWNLWVDTHNDYLVQKGVFVGPRFPSGYIFESNTSTPKHFEEYMGLLFYSKGKLSIGKYWQLDVTLQSVSANSEEGLFSYARETIEHPPNYSMVRDFTQAGSDGKHPLVTRVRYNDGQPGKE